MFVSQRQCPPLSLLPPTANSQSLEVDYVDLAHGLPVVAVWVADLPRDILPILDETALEVRTRGLAPDCPHAVAPHGDGQQPPFFSSDALSKPGRISTKHHPPTHTHTPGGAERV